MRKRMRMVQLIALMMLALALGMGTLAARVVATETLAFHAYIPEHTAFNFSEAGELLFSSNVPSAQLAVAYLQDATLLSVIAR